MGLFLNNNSIFGLDIGFETLKLVELKKNKSTSLVGFAEVPLTERILEKDHFKNKAQTANLIKEACRKAKPGPIKASKIVSALPESFVFSKTIQMPKMTKEEYTKAVPSEASQYLPMPVEEVYIDFQILIVHPDEPLVDLLIVASPKKLVDDYVEMTKMAGFELLALETKPIAVGRAVSKIAPLESCAIVEIGTEISRISIWDKTVRLINSVNTGKNHISESMGEELSGTKELKEDNISAVSVISNITDEVMNAIKYHQNRDYKPRPITKILLCGSGANIKGIDKIFESEIKIKSEIIKPKIDNKISLGTEFITSYGLALRSENE